MGHSHLKHSRIAHLDRVLERRERELRAEIRAQLLYGACARCGQGIGYERLAAYPAALRCLACEAQHEKTHVHEGTPTL